MRGSRIYQHLWSTAEVDDLIADSGRLARWVKIYGHLALAQAEHGFVPSDLAAEIADLQADRLDMDWIISETQRTSHSTLGLLRAMQHQLSPAAGEMVGFGATVQDVTDTWFALLMREVGDIVERDLGTTSDLLLDLAAEHAGTVMLGRTHGQAGSAVTAGLKFATWAEEIGRHLERLAAGRPRWEVVQLAGSVGTSAAWGDRATPLRASFAERLHLHAPDGPWLSARDRIAEFGCLLAMVCQTLGRIGNEVLQLQRTEIGELREGTTAGQVASITMPHKRNPETSEHLVTLARVARASAGSLLEAMLGEHERDGRSWKLEWIAATDLFQTAATSTGMAVRLVAGLEVDVAAMSRNVAATQGFVASEELMLRLAQQVGKQTALDLVVRATARGRKVGLDLAGSLAEDRAVRSLEADLPSELLEGRRPQIGSALEDVASVLRRRRTREGL